MAVYKTMNKNNYGVIKEVRKLDNMKLQGINI